MEEARIKEFAVAFEAAKGYRDRTTRFENAPQRSTGSRDSGDARLPVSVLIRALLPPVSYVCSPLASLGTKSNRARAKIEA